MRSLDPEVVFFVDYTADRDGWAHSLQVHPDGTADYIAHRPDQLNHGVRWISRTPDQDTLGIILPATAESEGYTAEKAKGYLRTLAPSRKHPLRDGAGLSQRNGCNRHDRPDWGGPDLNHNSPSLQRRPAHCKANCSQWAVKHVFTSHGSSFHKKIHVLTTIYRRAIV